VRIVITGDKGQLGQALHQALSGNQIVGLDLPEYDIGAADQIIPAIVDAQPDLVIHPAAMTDVDGCERDPELAFRVNALGTQNVALACGRCGAAMVHVSTNEVFDGKLGRPYYEWDAPSPLSVYARSKAAAEFYVRNLLRRFYIVRTAWLYGNGPRNFVETVLHLARERGALTMVTDEVGSPTYAPDLAEALAQLVRQPAYGTYHFVNQGVCSRHEWAVEVLRLAGLSNVPVHPSQDYQRLARVPKHVSLRNLCGAELGIMLRPWQEALAAYMDARQQIAPQ